MSFAQVTCRSCSNTFSKNCLFGYEAEKDFYLNYRPECPYCGIDPGDWKFDEILEVRSPLSGEEKDLFSLIGGKNEVGK